jgi:hypothetical protein
VRFGRDAGRLVHVGRVDDLRRSHTVVLTGLSARRGYAFRVESRDAGDNVSRGVVRRLRTLPSGVAMQTAPDFRTGRWTDGLVVDESGLGSLRLASPGRAAYTSRVLDSGVKTEWLRAVLKGSLPPGTSAVVHTRTGSTPEPGRAWTAWSAPRGDGDLLRQSGRYLQYRVVLVGAGARLPAVHAVGFTRSGAFGRHPHER